MDVDWLIISCDFSSHIHKFCIPLFERVLFDVMDKNYHPTQVTSSPDSSKVNVVFPFYQDQTTHLYLEVFAIIVNFPDNIKDTVLLLMLSPSFKVDVLRIRTSVYLVQPTRWRHLSYLATYRIIQDISGLEK